MSEHTNSMRWVSWVPIRSKNFWKAALVGSSPTPPGTKVSGGKVLSARTRRSTNRVRQALKLATMSLSRDSSALGAFYRRLCARMDKPRANTGVAHKLARMVDFMLTRRARAFSTRVTRATKNNSASAALLPSDAAPPT